MSGQPDEFLKLVLPQIAIARESATILADWDQYGKHGAAAHSLVDALCISCRSFEHISLPTLLGSSDPLPLDRQGDLIWLDQVGYHLSRELGRVNLVWPPPGVEPPAIVIDLREMYNGIANRHIVLPAVNAATLMGVVQAVGENACRLLSEWPTVGGAVADHFTWTSPGTVKFAKRLITTLGVIGAIIAFPGDLNSFPDETGKLVGNVTQVVESVSREIFELSKTLEFSSTEPQALGPDEGPKPRVVETKPLSEGLRQQPKNLIPPPTQHKSHGPRL